MISRAAADRVMALPEAHLSNSPITLFDNRTPTTLLAASRFDGRPRPRLLAANRLRFVTLNPAQKFSNRFGAPAPCPLFLLLSLRSVQMRGSLSLSRRFLLRFMKLKRGDDLL
jgi:hypothetical protein